MKSILFFPLLAAFGIISGSAFAADTVPPAAQKTTDPTVREARQMKMPEPANPQLPTVFFIGDSTVRNGRDDGQGKGEAGQWGWGHVIEQYFDTSKINVVNRAVGGLSSRTFLTGGHWDKALALMKAGDVVIMQFGHNDSGGLNDKPGPSARSRGTIPGTGAQTEEIDNLMTKQHEVVHTYGWYLRKFINDAKAKGVTPVVCSLIPRNRWDEAGKVGRQATTFAGWAKEVAAQEKVGFIDLNERVASKYEELGKDAAMNFFPPNEVIHTNWAGADLNAQMVIAGLKALKSDPLAKFYSAKGQAIAAAE